ncbi:MAG: hypothetical protein EBR82_30670 [Caulobacteraceae bacterium]|nr:hypothetical protein [Caulobacteraceae bacterium]
MPLILASNSASGGYNVANSLRFNSGSSDYLNRTLSTPTNNKLYTWSGWIKKTKNDEVAPNIFGAHSGGLRDCIRFDGGGNALQMIFNEAGSGNLVTTQVLRDVSAWYHIVVAVDTTQATSTNRVKIYLNGTQITSFSTSSYPAQNYTNILNAANPHVFGKNADLSNEFFNGYIAETYFIDGQQLTPSSFGQTDPSTPSSGIWVPKAYTGSYGNNGFYLQFKNSASLGTDSSGNGNTWTVNNLTSVDQSTDTPTNNFCTLNAIQNGNGSTSTLTEGNLVAGTADNKGVSANFGVNRGKWFWEIKNSGTQTNQRFGVSNRANEQDGDASPGADTANVRSYVGLNYQKNYSASSGTTNTGFVGTNGAIFGFALDLDNGTLGRYVNGSLISTDTTLPSDNSVTFFPFTQVTYNFGNWNQAQFNFGSPMYAGGGYADAAGYGNFSYAVPSGYYALCTKNLANFG